LETTFVSCVPRLYIDIMKACALGMGHSTYIHFDPMKANTDTKMIRLLNRTSDDTYNAKVFNNTF